MNPRKLLPDFGVHACLQDRAHAQVLQPGDHPTSPKHSVMLAPEAQHLQSQVPHWDDDDTTVSSTYRRHLQLTILSWIACVLFVHVMLSSASACQYGIKLHSQRCAAERIMSHFRCAVCHICMIKPRNPCITIIFVKHIYRLQQDCLAMLLLHMVSHASQLMLQRGSGLPQDHHLTHLTIVAVQAASCACRALHLQQRMVCTIIEVPLGPGLRRRSTCSIS